MQVAVAGVEDVHDQQVIARRDLLGEAQDLGQARSWDDPILNVIMRAQTATGGERALATGPQLLALVFVAGSPQLARAVRPADRLDSLGLRIQLLAQPI